MLEATNKKSVLQSLTQRVFTVEICDVGLPALNTHSQLACSPDVVALLGVCDLFLTSWTSGADLTMYGKDHRVSSMKIKARVFATTLRIALQLSSVEIELCEIDDDKSKRCISAEHMPQFVQQATVFSQTLYFTQLHLRPRLCVQIYSR